MTRRRLVWLAVEGFRNLRSQRLPLDGPLVLLSGANAQGKTSLLEAAYLLATTKSFRSRDFRDVISHGSNFLTVGGELSFPGDSLPINLGIRRHGGRGERSLLVGQYEVKLAEYLGFLPALVMTGDTPRRAAGSPGERRRYIDRATAAAMPEQLPDLAEYGRALVQRNLLLKKGASDDELEPWDVILARAGERIAKRRVEQISAWQGEIRSWRDIFPEVDELRLGYRLSGARGGEADLLDRLRQSRASDKKTGVTTVGPHRDDFSLEIGGKSLWSFGSAGQVRSALAITTLAQARQIRNSRKEVEPLLLLDDVDTDLDTSRLGAFLEAASREGQVITASSKPELPVPPGAVRLQVRDGKLSVRNDD